MNDLQYLSVLVAVLTVVVVTANIIAIARRSKSAEVYRCNLKYYPEDRRDFHRFCCCVRPKGHPGEHDCHCGISWEASNV